MLGKLNYSDKRLSE